MPVTDIRKDLDACTMVVTAEFDAPPERVWQVWADPRQLERWWGPPTYPATVTEHDLSPGGRVAYRMTGPEGEQHGGWWRIIAVDAPRGLEFEDGFADADGEPNPDMPTMRMRVSLAERPGGGTRMTTETVFPSSAAMQQLVDMGMEEGLTAATAQIDDLVREEVSSR